MSTDTFAAHCVPTALLMHIFFLTNILPAYTRHQTNGTPNRESHFTASLLPTPRTLFDARPSQRPAEEAQSKSTSAQNLAEIWSRPQNPPELPGQLSVKMRAETESEGKGDRKRPAQSGSFKGPKRSGSFKGPKRSDSFKGPKPAKPLPECGASSTRPAAEVRSAVRINDLWNVGLNTWLALRVSDLRVCRARALPVLLTRRSWSLNSVRLEAGWVRRLHQ